MTGRAVGAQSGDGDVVGAPAVAWNRAYGDEFWQRAWSVVQAPDGGYAATGYTTDGYPAEPDLRLVRLTADF